MVIFIELEQKHLKIYMGTPKRPWISRSDLKEVNGVGKIRHLSTLYNQATVIKTVHIFNKKKKKKNRNELSKDGQKPEISPPGETN